jgi:hypothetical protein
MRFIYVMTFTLCFTMSNSQVMKLNSFIKGKLIHFSPINNSNSDIYGYFYLYDMGKADKKTYDYEYALLDKNLNLVCTGQFQEKKYSSLFGTTYLMVNVNYIHDKILIKIFETYDYSTELFVRYRYIDLNTNTLSPNYQFKNDSLLIGREINRTYASANENKDLEPAQGIGIFNNINISKYEYKDIIKKEEKYNNRKIFMFDDNFEIKWEHKIDKLGQVNLTKLYSDSSILVFYTTNYETKSQNTLFHTIKVLEAKSGLIRFEVLISGKGKSIKSFDKIHIDKDKLSLYGKYGEKINLDELLDIEAQGLYTLELDINTGEVIKDKSISWPEIGLYLKQPMYKDGKIKKTSASPFVHEFVPLSNGKSIVVIETYEVGRPILRDLIFLTLDDNFSPVENMYIEKNNRIKLKGSGSYLKLYNQFDYYFSQSLDEVDEFLFFYNVNKKGVNIFSKSNDYHILSYLNNKFNSQKIELKTENSQIYPLPAKKGFILLLEIFKDSQKSSELRLERINL